MLTCKRCGAPIDPNGSFCSKCGTAQAVTPGVAPSYVPPSAAAGSGYVPAPAMPRKKGHPVLKVIGIIFAVFVGLGIWGAILKSNHTGGPSGSSPGSAPYANSYEETQQMCGVIKQRLKDYFQGSANAIECKSGMGDDGTLSLIIAYPYPVLGKEGKVKNNALLDAVAMAGEAMSEHANVAIGRVYVMDSSPVCFVVSGPYARQMYTKVMNKQAGEKELEQDISQAAKKVKIPEIHR